MRVASRLVCGFVVIAHVWVAALPCAPGRAGFEDERIALSVAEAEALLELARSDSPERSRPEAHGRHHGAHGHGDGQRHGQSHAESHPGRAEEVAAAPPCHAPPATDEEAEPAPFASGLLFFVPACPCGCDQRGPVAGASSARLGAGVPPASELAQPVPPSIAALRWRSAPAPDVQPSLPDPVPRRDALA